MVAKSDARWLGLREQSAYWRWVCLRLTSRNVTNSYKEKQYWQLLECEGLYSVKRFHSPIEVECNGEIIKGIN